MTLTSPFFIIQHYFISVKPSYVLPFPKGEKSHEDIEKRSDPEKIWDKIEFDNDCWLWKNAKTMGKTKSGYGRMKFMGRGVLAHRFVYQYLTGEEIPEKLELDHLCRNRACVNPDHLEIVTHAENLKRGAINQYVGYMPAKPISLLERILEFFKNAVLYLK